MDEQKNKMKLDSIKVRDIPEKDPKVTKGGGRILVHFKIVSFIFIISTYN